MARPLRFFILKGTLEDDSYFTFIYAYNQEYDWKDAKNLIKANPALGSFLKEDVLLSDLNDAMLTPSHVPDFKSKTCGIWTNDVSNWISNEKWNKCCVDKIDWSDFEGAECWCGLDLSEVHDVTAFTLCFHKDGKFYFKHHFYVPSETIAERYQKKNINFYDWADKGIVTVINGATIDFTFFKTRHKMILTVIIHVIKIRTDIIKFLVILLIVRRFYIYF